MRLVPTPEMKRLEKIFDPYIKRNNKGDYMPDDAPEEAKEAYKKWRELKKKEYDEAIALWG